MARLQNGGLPMLAALLAGWALMIPPPTARDTRPSWVQVQEWMARSTSWQAAKQQVVHPFCMEERTDGTAVVVYIGEDFGDHTCRIATLRVWGDGQIERQMYDPQGEFVWVDDQ